MGLPGKDRTDERLSGGIEEHGMSGLPDTNLIDHAEEGIEPVGGFNGSDHGVVTVIEDGHRDVDGFLRRPERAILRRNHPAEVHVVGATRADRFPPGLIAE